MRYIALLDRGRPIEDPLMIVRVDGDREEMFVPGRFRGRWESCDPLYRTWFVNVAITEEHAKRLLRTVKPTGPLEKPKNDDWCYFALETAEHPLDDPLTVIKRDCRREQDQIFTTDLVWQVADPEGRRVRITKEDAQAFEDIQSKRVFGDIPERYFAITNPFDQDVDAPPVIARELIDDGTVHQERYDGTWVRSGTISDIRTNRKDGRLTPLTGETAADLVAHWRPRPDRSGYYAGLNRSAPSLEEPEVLLHVEEDGGVNGSRLNSKGNWYRVNMWTALENHELVKIDHATLERLAEHIDFHDAMPRPDDVRYQYWAIVGDAKTDDPMTASALLRSWNGTTREERFNPRNGRWLSSIVRYEIHFGHRFDDDLEITEEVAERLREKLVGQVGFEPTT